MGKAFLLMFNSRNANGWSIREEEDCGLEGFDVKSNENLDMEEMKGLTEAELNKVETQVAEALRGAARFEPVDNDMLGDIDSGDVGHLESGDPFNILVGMSKERRAWFEDKIRPIQSMLTKVRDAKFGHWCVTYQLSYSVPTHRHNHSHLNNTSPPSSLNGLNSAESWV